MVMKRNLLLASIAVTLTILAGCEKPEPEPPIVSEYTAYFTEKAIDVYFMGDSTLYDTYGNDSVSSTAGNPTFTYINPWVKEEKSYIYSLSFNADKSCFLPVPIYDGRCVFFDMVYDGDSERYDPDEELYYVPRKDTHIISSPSDINIVFWTYNDETKYGVFADVNEGNKSALLNPNAYTELDTVPEWFTWEEEYIYHQGMYMFDYCNIKHYRLTCLDREYFDNLIPVRDSLHAEELLRQYGTPGAKLK